MKLEVTSLSIIVQPSPAHRRSARHAASVWMMVDSPRAGVGSRNGIAGFEGTVICSLNHSCAAVTALVMISSGVVVLLLKILLFLANHSDHRIQGARGPEEIPDGGRHTSLESPCQVVVKSSNLLESILDEKEASFHTL